jgi:hypothetical protein
VFRNYDVSDGLQGDEFSQRCYFQGPDGEMFFCGSNGFNAFFPETIRDNPYVPPVVITGLKIFNEPVPIGPKSVLKQAIQYVDSLTLPYSDNVFSYDVLSTPRFRLNFVSWLGRLRRPGSRRSRSEAMRSEAEA